MESSMVTHHKNGAGKHTLRFKKGYIDETIRCFAGGRNCVMYTLSDATDLALSKPLTSFTGKSLFGTRVAVLAYIDDGHIEIHYYDEKSDEIESYYKPSLKQGCPNKIEYGSYARVAMECAEKYVEENFM